MAYQTMTAATLRSTVRDITDLNATDLPDSLLNLFIRDGYYRILDLEQRWTFLETSFDITTVVNQRAYTIADLTADPIASVVSITDAKGVGKRLEMVGYDTAETTYLGTYDTAGDPLFYSVWQGQIHLFPKPKTVRTLKARGYREPIDWATTGGAIDATPNLHFALVYYACSRIYQRFEDGAMAEVYKRAFDEGVQLAKLNISKPTSHAYTVLSAGRTKGRPTFNGWTATLGRNFDWSQY